jgi:hypothetical protein
MEISDLAIETKRGIEMQAFGYYKNKPDASQLIFWRLLVIRWLEKLKLA